MRRAGRVCPIGLFRNFKPDYQMFPSKSIYGQCGSLVKKIADDNDKGETID